MSNCHDVDEFCRPKLVRNAHPKAVRFVFVPAAAVLPTLSHNNLTRRHNQSITTSPAVAERPRDASCMSVASTVQKFVESNLLLLVTRASDLPLRTNKFCCVLFSSLWSSMLQAVINKDSLMRVRRRLCGKLHGRRRICCSHSTDHRSIASYSSRIAIFPTSPAFDAPV